MKNSAGCNAGHRHGTVLPTRLPAQFRLSRLKIGARINVQKVSVISPRHSPGADCFTEPAKRQVGQVRKALRRRLDIGDPPPRECRVKRAARADDGRTRTDETVGQILRKKRRIDWNSQKAVRFSCEAAGN